MGNLVTEHDLRAPANVAPPCGKALQQVVQQYAPLVRRLAFQFMSRLPASVQVEDVIQNGMIGLLDSATRFEEGMGAQFETYATQRIRGAMIDGLRENDWMPRALRRDMRRIEAASRALEQQHGRSVGDTEIAAALDMPLIEYQKTIRDARASQMVHLEDFSADGEEDFLDRNLGDVNADPLHQLIERRDQEGLAAAIGKLPERERLMMRLYYEEDLNLREIGEMLGVSESRVCQLHKQAVGRLRGELAAEARPRMSPALKAAPSCKLPVARAANDEARRVRPAARLRLVQGAKMPRLRAVV